MLAYTTCGEIFKAVDAFHTEIELFVSKLFEHTTYYYRIVLAKKVLVVGGETNISKERKKKS